MKPTILLTQSLARWGADDFIAVLQQELAQHRELLPLQQALSYGNYVAASPITILVNRCQQQDDSLLIWLDIHYQSIIAGCSCADDPSPINELNEVCHLLLRITQNNALTSWQLLE